MADSHPKKSHTKLAPLQGIQDANYSHDAITIIFIHYRLHFSLC